MTLPTVFAQSGSRLPFRNGALPLLLHFNENSLGMSPQAITAAKQAIVHRGNRYPDESVTQLQQALATKHNVPLEQVILGNGSTEVIGAIVTESANRGVTIIEPSPTFGDVRRRSEAAGLSVIRVPVGDDFITDIDMLKKRAALTKGPLLINICNPNNPTGSIVEQTALFEWIKNAPEHHTFLIDEAYFEYAQLNPDYHSVLSLIKLGKENLILTRTFSKIYGMAGMRVGYGIAAPITAKRIARFAASFNLSAAGVAAALASLQDQNFYQHSLSSNQKAKTILLNTLDELGLEYVRSDTNFVLHRINSDLKSYAQRMADNGISVGRRMTEKDGWNRISIGKPNEMELFSKTLNAFREKRWV